MMKLTTACGLILGALIAIGLTMPAFAGLDEAWLPMTGVIMQPPTANSPPPPPVARRWRNTIWRECISPEKALLAIAPKA